MQLSQQLVTTTTHDYHSFMVTTESHENPHPHAYIYKQSARSLNVLLDCYRDNDNVYTTEYFR